MAIISANMEKLFDARIGKAFFDYLKMYGDEYKAWCDVLSSSKQYERDAMFGEVPMPDEVGEYENTPETSFPQGPQRTWTHKKYGFTVIASEECIEDELFPVVVKTAGAMGKAMAHRLNTQGAYDLNMAFTENTVGASDTADETLCATSHASFGDGAAQSNNPSPDITLDVDSLWAGINNFSGLNDREGNPIMQIPQTLIIHPNNERVAIEVLESAQAPYLTTNELNAVRKKGLKYEVGHYLTSTTAWFIITNEKPIRYYMRRKPTVKAESTIRNDSRSWTMTARLSHGPFDWYGIYGTDGVA